MDAVLGPPASGWEGGIRRMDLEGHVATGGDAIRAKRHLLLPALWAAQSREGWISPGALNYICQRLSVAPAEAWGVATFYAMFSVDAAAEDDRARLRRHRLPARGRRASFSRTFGRRLPKGACEAVPCLGLCERAPAALVQTSGEGAEGLRASPPCRPRELAASPRPGERPSGSARRAPSPRPRRWTRAARKLRLLARVGRVDPGSLDDYRAHGGYAALERAFALGPEGVDPRGPRVEARGPRRRGVPRGPQVGSRREAAGAAALPRLQRRRVRARHLQGPRPHGGGSLRGARGDDDRRLRDGLRARLHLRSRRVPAGDRAARGRDRGRARAAGSSAPRVAGEDFAFDIEVRRGAGAYICGEETALFNSIEGFRGEPRNKPPFPVEKGLFGKPTVINNVETLVCVQHIVLGGGAAFAAIGSGPVDRPQALLPLGQRRAARRLRGRVRRDAPPAPRRGRRRARRPGHPGDPPRRRGRLLRRARRLWTCR